MDITRCSGDDCPKKESCLRFTAAVHGRQDFFTPPPYDTTTANCTYYINDQPTEDEIRKQAYHFWMQDGCFEGYDTEYWLRAKDYLVKIRREGV